MRVIEISDVRALRMPVACQNLFEVGLYLLETEQPAKPEVSFILRITMVGSCGRRDGKMS